MTFRAMTGVLAAGILLSQAQTPPPPPPPSSGSPSGSPLAAAAAAAKSARGTPAPTEPGIGLPIKLTFAWPAGMTATIETERTKTQLMMGQKKESGAGMRYRMRVSPHPRGRLITYDNFEMMRTLLSRPEEAEIMEYLGNFMPNIVVNNEGEFLRVDNIAKIKAAMREFIDGVMREAPGAADVPANVKAMLESFASEEVLSQLAAQDWQLFAGAFAGYAGKIGDTTEVDTEEASPIVPGVMIPMRSSFGALHRVPCEPGRAPDSCVVMQLRATVKPGAMQTVVKKLLEGVKDLEGLKYDRFDVITELQATLEPSTMKPYRILHTKTADFTMSMVGQGSMTAQVIEKRTYRIKYAQ